MLSRVRYVLMLCVYSMQVPLRIFHTGATHCARGGETNVWTPTPQSRATSCTFCQLLCPIGLHQHHFV